MTGKGSAIRRVTLVILAAVLFGISIALKDGAEKASEYFAGCVICVSCDLTSTLFYKMVLSFAPFCTRNFRMIYE